jgi:hypothetical protein
MRVRVTVLALAGLMLASSCAKVPPPTQEELYARDQWAAVVTEEDRRQVFAEANNHTSWSEKRKVQYETLRFQKLQRNEERKQRWNEPSRKAGTRPATHPTEHMAEHSTTARSSMIHSTTRATTRPTTRRHSTTRRGTTTRPGDDDSTGE